MRIKRDTVPATLVWQMIAKNRREELKQEIRKDILPSRAEHCYKREVTGFRCARCEQSDLKRCTSYSNLAKVLTILEIPGVRGNSVKWDATRVKRLFRQ